MASTINAITTGVGGIVTSADASGVLALQTGGTTAVTIDASQNVSFTKAINKAALPTGSVLQVVTAYTSTAVTNNTSTLVSTGLSTSITPLFSTSKILVIASLSGIYKFTNNTGATIQLWRGAGNIQQFALTAAGSGTTAPMYITQTNTYLDSPATTSATTYTLYFASQQNIAGVTVQTNGDISAITLMEIAA